MLCRYAFRGVCLVAFNPLFKLLGARELHWSVCVWLHCCALVEPWLAHQPGDLTLCTAFSRPPQVTVSNK